MSLDFTSRRKTLGQRHHQRLAREAQGLPLVRRFDLAFFALFGVVALFLLAFWSISVATGWRFGFFDPPLMRAVPDERVLTNLRDDLVERPLLASTLHQDRLYVSQAGGDLHRFDPRTELWTSEPMDEGLGDLVDLRSEALGLWARSARGGLAHLRDGQWTTIFAESAFVGTGDVSPSTEDLSTAALSDDGRWLLLGSRAHGVGLFDQERRDWVSLKSLLDVLPSPVVTHLRWWRDRFWIGGPQGISFLIPDATAPRIDVRPDLDGTITDLDAGDALWILATRDCLNEASGNKRCTRLSRLVEPEAVPLPLVDEKHHYPQLDLAGLRVVQQQGEMLVVAGNAGLFTYDPRNHSWNQHLDRPVLAHWRDGDSGLYVGTNAGAAYFAVGRLQHQWPLGGASGQRIRRIVPAGGGEMLAFTDEGNIWSLPPNKEAQAVFISTWTHFDPRSFSAAMVLEDGQVLFRGPGGLVAHDVLKRTYEDFSRRQLPAWLFDPLARFEASGQRLYGLLPATLGRHSVVVTDPSRMARSDFDEPGRVPTPIELTAPWGDQGLAILAGDGSAYLAGEQTLRRMTGAAADDLMNATWNDVALEGERLAVATNQGLRVYRQDRRTWRNWILPGVPIRQVAATGGELRMLTADGRLARPDAEDPFVIGGEHQDWRLSPAGLTDALMAEGQVYLAGDGEIHRYDPKRRRINWQWLVGRPLGGLSSRDPIETHLIDVVGTGNRAQPLSWSGDRAYLGAIELDPNAGRVVGVSLGPRYIWTVRERKIGGPRYLKGYSRDQPFEPGRMRCLFRHSSAGNGRPKDVRQIHPDLLAVATGEGLKLYSRNTRSWYDVHWRGRPLLRDLPDASQDGVLFHLGRSLALWTEASASGRRQEAKSGRLQLVDMDDLRVPPSCSGRAVVDVEVRVTIDARAIAFKERQALSDRQAAAVWIAPDGAVKRWAEGDTTTLLTAPTGAPRSRDLRRAFRFGEYLVFTGEASLYVYHLTHHTWSTHPVVLPSRQTGAITDIAIEGSAAPWTVTVSTASGTVFVGDFDPEGSLKLREVLSARAQRRGSLGADPLDLLDVQWRLGKWAFIMTDRLVVFDPEARVWQPPIVFPGPPDPTLSLRQAVGIDVVIKEQGRQWWIEQETDAVSGKADPRFALYEPGGDLATAIDQRARVWRLREGGRVERCEASAGVYSCQVEIAADPADPVTAFEPGPGGVGLLAKRQQGASTALTGQRVEMDPRLPPAVATGWLAWQRDTGTFRLAMSSGVKTFSPRELFSDGRLLFEDVRAVLAESPFRLHAATPQGVWTFRRGSLSLARQNGSAGPAQAMNAAAARVVFTPIALGNDIRGAHGRFLTPKLSYEISRAGPEPSAYTEHHIQIGAQVTLVERFRDQVVSGTIEGRGDTLSAFADAGFAWDQRREVFAHPDRGFLLSSGAGVHPLALEQERAGFDLEAESLASVRTSVTGDRALVDTPFWSWTRHEGNLRTRAKDQTHRLRLRWDADGWRLTSDRLWSAAFHGQRLHLLTEASHEELGESLDAQASIARAPIEADLLESLRPRPDAPAELFARKEARSGPSWSRWDPQTGTFQTWVSEEDPRRNRERVLHGRLRLRLRGGRVVGYLQVEDPDTAVARWKPFELSTRGFPFDQVTALGGIDGHLLLSTAAGLQVYKIGGGKDLDKPEAIFDLPGKRARIGRPLHDPSRLLVVTEDACFEWRDQQLTRCVGRESLDQRFRGENDLWRFTLEKGRPRGFYKDIDGRVTETEVRLSEGRLAHDHLRDLASCEGVTASLWRNGWISLHADSTLSLTGSHNHDSLAAQRPRELLCVQRQRQVALPSAGSAALSLARGLYVTNGERYWHWHNETWTAVTDARLRDALAQPPLQQFGRLRLIRRPGAGFVYQIRTAGGQWVDLAWRNGEGRLSIDVIEDVQVESGTLWARTPIGIVPFGRGADGTLTLLPQEISVVAPPRVAGQLCAMTDFALADGRAVVRCDFDSRKVFERGLRLGLDEEEKTEEFRPLVGQDPFAESHFITAENSGFWNWRLSDRRGGRPGILEARLQGEPLGLNQGRFDFDHLTSVTLTSSVAPVELVSGVGGWYRHPGGSHPGGSLHVRDLARPEVTGQIRPEEVTRVELSQMDGDGTDLSTLRLCVTANDDTAFVLTADTVVGSATECVETLGRAGLWSYERLADQLRIRAPGVAGGWAHRTLEEGRLADQIALGPPIAGSAAANPEYLVPTAAGVVRLDASGTALAVQAPRHQGLEPGQVATVLWLTAEGRADYVTSSGVRDLATGAVVSDDSFRLPDGARAIAMENSSPDLLRLVWKRDGEPGWTLLRADTYAALGDHVLAFDAGEWARFQRGRMGWGSPASGFGLRLLARDSMSRELELFTAAGDQAFALPWRGGQNPLGLELRGPRLYVIQRDEISELRLDIGIEELFQ